MKILVASWDSGGGVEVVQTVVGRAVARGHDVRVLGTEGLRARFEAAGATFRRYQHAPDNDTSSPETDLVKDWEASNPLKLFGRVRDRLLCGPARDFCLDVAEELASAPADVVVIDTMIPAAMFGAESAGVPSVILMHGPCMIPRPGAPAFGTGFMPATTSLGRLRDKAMTALALGVMRSGLPALNQARSDAGLPPIRDLFDLMDRADRILVCSSPSYDFGSASVPANTRYVGPQLDFADRGTFDDSLLARPGRPLVLVGLSSTVMLQERLLQRAADALGQLDVTGLITTGPAIDPAVISAPANVVVRQWARHADVLPHCSAVITHGGHGTVMKALLAGIPQIVVPLGRDQPDNAARVVELGAGIRLPKKASVGALSDAVEQILARPACKAAAVAAAARLQAERDDGKVIDELERAASHLARKPAGVTARRTAD
jgi:MGT family glycosyltransferase